MLHFARFCNMLCTRKGDFGYISICLCTQKGDFGYIHLTSEIDSIISTFLSAIGNWRLMYGSGNMGIIYSLMVFCFYVQ